MPHLLRFVPSMPNLSLTGIIDILVVAFVVYQALMVVRGTRAGHILIGILTMVSIYALALWGGLEALRSLLSFIVPYLAWQSSCCSNRKSGVPWRASGERTGL